MEANVIDNRNLLIEFQNETFRQPEWERQLANMGF